LKEVFRTFKKDKVNYLIVSCIFLFQQGTENSKVLDIDVFSLLFNYINKGRKKDLVSLSVFAIVYS